MNKIISFVADFLNRNMVAAYYIFGAIFAYIIVPVYASQYMYEAFLLPFLALSLAAVGLNLLTGYGGLISLGTSAFMAVGAFAAFNLNLRIEGMPFILTIVFAGLITAAIGLFFGLPSLRLRGFYLAVTTLAAQFFIPWVFGKIGWFSNNSLSGLNSVPDVAVLGFRLNDVVSRYLVSLTFVIFVSLFIWRVVGSQIGKNLIALRDNEIAAGIVGVPVIKTKMLAFGLSSFVIGIAGVLWAFTYVRTIEPIGYDLDRSFQILFIIIIGGMATIRGAFLGAAFIVGFPLVFSGVGLMIFGSAFDSGAVELTQRIVNGIIVITLLIYEPDGLAALFNRFRTSRRQRITG